MNGPKAGLMEKDVGGFYPAVGRQRLIKIIIYMFIAIKFTIIDKYRTLTTVYSCKVRVKHIILLIIVTKSR